VGESLDRIANAVFRAKGDQTKRNKVYSDALDTLGRENKKISNLRESMVSVERLLLFLMSEGRPESAPTSMREATKTALRDLQTMEQNASFKAQRAIPTRFDARPHRPRSERHHQALLGDRGHLHPPTVIASIYGMNFKEMPGLDWKWGYPLAITLMAFAAIGPYLFFHWKKWL
jgi:magnesium transporter